jgi:hypothetical protein
MNYTKRTLVVLAGLLVLAASSQAQITFGPNPSAGIVFQPNEANITPPNLSQIAFGPASDTGSFTVSSSTGIKEIDVTDVDGQSQDGTLTLTVTDTTTGKVLYSDSTSANNPLLDETPNHVSIGTGLQTITYSATFTGSAPDSVAVINNLSVVFTPNGVNPPPPVPEPASFGVMGIGVVGLILRNRRRNK